MIEIIKISEETFIERMKACCSDEFSDEALSLLYEHLNKEVEEQELWSDIQIDEKWCCHFYKECSIEEYIRKYPPQEFEELGKDYPIERRILMSNLLLAKCLRHEIVGFTETTIIYSDY